VERGERPNSQKLGRSKKSLEAGHGSGEAGLGDAVGAVDDGDHHDLLSGNHGDADRVEDEAEDDESDGGKPVARGDVLSKLEHFTPVCCICQKAL